MLRAVTCPLTKRCYGRYAVTAWTKSRDAVTARGGPLNLALDLGLVEVAGVLALEMSAGYDSEQRPNNGRSTWHRNAAVELFAPAT
jgi:hypothetical protein